MSGKEVINNHDVTQVDTDALQEFYLELTNLVGVEPMLKIYEHYRGSQLTIPTHLYDRKRAARTVAKQYDGNNSMALARKYGYSEKWVKKSIKDNKKIE